MCELIVIGTSLGGTNALEVILSSLSKDFSVPIAIVQHRDVENDTDVCKHLQRFTSLKVKESDDKERISPGFIYIAPPNYHLLVNGKQFALSTEEPVFYARPSIDVLFESSADSYLDKLIGIILTGGGIDGVKGLSAVKKLGGLTIVQDPKTAQANGLPESAIATNQVDKILPIEKIGSFLVNICKGKE